MDSKPVVFRPAAERDLDEIWLYIAFDNPAAADAVVDQIQKRTQQLSAFPQTGRLRPEIAEDARSVPVRTYLILYREAENFIDIVRVVHGARDLTALF